MSIHQEFFALFGDHRIPSVEGNFFTIENMYQMFSQRMAAELRSEYMGADPWIDGALKRMSKDGRLNALESAK